MNKPKHYTSQTFKLDDGLKAEFEDNHTLTISVPVDMDSNIDSNMDAIVDSITDPELKELMRFRLEDLLYNISFIDAIKNHKI